MANLKSSIKDVRRSERRRVLNKSQKSAMRTEFKKLLQYIDTKEPIEKTQQHFNKVMAMLDRISRKNILHRNNVSRKKSSLHKLLNEYLRNMKNPTTPAPSPEPSTPGN